MLQLSREMHDQIEAQRAALAERVEDSQLYTHEPAQFALAVDAYLHVADDSRRAPELWVAEDLGNLTSPESRNIVRKVRLLDGSLGVFKVIGSTDEPGEAALLEGWGQKGLPVVELLDDGEVTLGGRTALYVLTRYIDAPTLAASPVESLTGKREQVRDLAALVKRFHDSGVKVPETRSWSSRLQFHWQWTIPLLLEHGLRMPDQWRRMNDQLSSLPGVVLHGDFAPVNTLDTKATLGTHTSIDPPGAIRGAREADLGQLVSQVGNVKFAEQLVADAVEAYGTFDGGRTLDPQKVAAFAGLNLLTWAGYALVGHDNPDVKTVTGPDRQQAEQAQETAQLFLDTAERLIAPYRESMSATVRRPTLVIDLTQQRSADAPGLTAAGNAARHAGPGAAQSR